MSLPFPPHGVQRWRQTHCRHVDTAYTLLSNLTFPHTFRPCVAPHSMQVRPVTKHSWAQASHVSSMARALLHTLCQAPSSPHPPFGPSLHCGVDVAPHSMQVRPVTRGRMGTGWRCQHLRSPPSTMAVGADQHSGEGVSDQWVGERTCRQRVGDGFADMRVRVCQGERVCCRCWISQDWQACESDMK